MDPSQLIGSSWVVGISGAVTVAYCAGLVWLTYSIYTATPELLQLRLFRNLRVLQNSVLFMGLGLMLWMVMTTLFVSNIALPDVVWVAAVVFALAFLGFGMYQYSSVMSVPRVRIAADEKRA